MPGATTFDDVDDRIDVPAAGPNQVANYTVASWIRPNTDVDFEAIFGDTFPALGYGITYHVGLAVNRAIEHWQNNTLQLRSAAGSAPINVWTFWAVTHDGTNGRLYVGRLDRALTLEQTTAYGSQTFLNVTHRIGQETDGTRTFPGEIAHVKIWNKALSLDELQNEWLFAVPSNRNSQNLILWYPLWESARGTAFDLSGRGNNGTDASGPTTGEGPPIRLSRAGWPMSIRPQAAAAPASVVSPRLLGLLGVGA